MPRYTVWYVVHAAASMMIDAANPDEARTKAEDALDVPLLCHYCANKLELEDAGNITEIREEHTP